MPISMPRTTAAPGASRRAAQRGCSVLPGRSERPAGRTATAALSADGSRIRARAPAAGRGARGAGTPLGRRRGIRSGIEGEARISSMHCWALARLKRIRLACDDAIPLYEQAETVRPTFDGAYGLGVCYGYLQRDDEAVGKFEAATRRDPKAAVAWVGLGTSLAKTGRAAEGIPKLQHAIALEPKMGEAYYALGMAYQAARQTAAGAEGVPSGRAARRHARFRVAPSAPARPRHRNDRSRARRCWSP